MDEQMFCFQCEQAAGCTACTGKAGVCGKSADTAAAQDRLTGALITCAGQLLADEQSPSAQQAMLLMQGLFTTITNVNFDAGTVDELTAKVRAACPAAGSGYNMQLLWHEPDADVRSLKSFVLFSLRGMAAYNYHARVLGHVDPELDRFFCTALDAISRPLSMEELWALVQKTGEASYRCMELLDAANTGAFGTTSVVAYPGVPHIDEGRDFSPVIEKALELGGYAQDTLLPGLNGGSTVTTGFARTAVLQHADEIVQAVRDGKLRHFFLVGGCDGTRPSRRYYTEFARLTPPDTILLTLACGKFRLNDLPLGTVPGTGLPRILDVGQCNDAYSAIRIALALADAFGCGVNDLPLSLVLCWFEQKAVCILIALLALGIRNIRLGPTLPPFLSPGVVAALQQKYDLKAVTTPENDLQAILGRH